jgi:hypothetical protein
MKIIGITLGPILETISESRKIYEIANASAFFSTFMYEFLKKVADSKKYEIITPYFEYEEENKLYPDRAILKIENSDENEKIVNEIEEFKDAAFNKFLERIKNSESKNDVLEDLEKINEIVKKNENKDYKYNREKQIDLLKEYINFNTVLMNIEKSEEIKDIFSKLDGIELIKNFPIQYNEKEINEIIADSLSEKIKLNENSFSVNENKYRAIISLDLDNRGKFSQKEIKKIKKVSEGIYKYISKLRNFIKSKEINRKSEGLVLYAAGDDILAILNPKYIFEFIKEACNSLKESFKEVIEDNKELSVSFGIFICYEKNPIKESIEKAHDLLFYNAKKLNEKNSAVILVQKHSGYSFEFVINDLVKEIEFNKDNIFFDKMNNYLKDYMESKKVEKKELLNTIIQKVYMNDFIFKEIIKNPEQIRYFLDNLFDSNAKGNPLIRDLEELLIHIGKENPERKKEEFEIKLEKVISYFKLIKFYEDRGGK